MKPQREDDAGDREGGWPEVHSPLIAQPRPSGNWNVDKPSLRRMRERFRLFVCLTKWESRESVRCATRLMTQGFQDISEKRPAGNAASNSFLRLKMLATRMDRTCSIGKPPTVEVFSLSRLHKQPSLANLAVRPQEWPVIPTVEEHQKLKLEPRHAAVIR